MFLPQKEKPLKVPEGWLLLEDTSSESFWLTDQMWADLAAEEYARMTLARNRDREWDLLITSCHGETVRYSVVANITYTYTIEEITE